jgi:hypothetical protein
MLASGFTNAPITQLLLLGVVGSAIIASLTDTKYFLWIEVRPHLLDYWQYWRLLTWQLAYTNSAEVLFAAMTFYQLRVIERLWGSRKFAVGKHTFHSIRECPRHYSLSNGGLTGKYFTVLSPFHLLLHRPPPSHPPRRDHPSVVVGSHQLPALRSDALGLRTAGPVPCGCAVHLQIPPIERILDARVRSDTHVQSDILPPTHATRSLAAAWIRDRGWRRLDHRVRPQEGDFAWDDEMEIACVDCWRRGAKGEVRQSEEKDGGRGWEGYGRAD